MNQRQYLEKVWREGMEDLAFISLCDESEALDIAAAKYRANGERPSPHLLSMVKGRASRKLLIQRPIFERPKLISVWVFKRWFAVLAVAFWIPALVTGSTLFYLLAVSVAFLLFSLLLIERRLFS